MSECSQLEYKSFQINEKIMLTMINYLLVKFVILRTVFINRHLKYMLANICYFI